MPAKPRAWPNLTRPGKSHQEQNEQDAEKSAQYHYCDVFFERIRHSQEVPRKQLIMDRSLNLKVGTIDL